MGRCLPRIESTRRRSRSAPALPFAKPFPRQRTSAQRTRGRLARGQDTATQRREPRGNNINMLRRGTPAAALLPVVLLLLAVAAEASAAVEPMEVYFSAAELARVAGYGEEPVSSVSVAGQVACELCLRPGSDLLTFELPGAKVAVTCETEGVNNHQAANSAFATTDEYGNFSIDLPSHLHATPNIEKACAVKVLQLPADTSCRLGHRPGATYGLMLLSSEEDGVRAYTAGVIRLQNGGAPSDRCVSVENITERRR
ncbi:hypothetical protein U9M48_044766 [Paspalum notatum var. saurae]|uniref:Pollen Ole e 1 allergen and extensin family protein n=1 Tax=Paspalum notatum var. saurae TaxID=547442 RepID=A0AAQ3XIL7_PASNO